MLESLDRRGWCYTPVDEETENTPHEEEQQQANWIFRVIAMIARGAGCHGGCENEKDLVLNLPYLPIDISPICNEIDLTVLE